MIPGARDKNGPRNIKTKYVIVIVRANIFTSFLLQTNNILFFFGVNKKHIRYLKMLLSLSKTLIPLIWLLNVLLFTEAVAQRCFVKKVFLEISQISQENTYARASFLIELETHAQVFSCEFCKIYKNYFSKRIPPVCAYLFIAWTALMKNKSVTTLILENKANYVKLYLNIRLQIVSFRCVSMIPNFVINFKSICYFLRSSFF